MLIKAYLHKELKATFGPSVNVRIVHDGLWVDKECIAIFDRHSHEQSGEQWFDPAETTRFSHFIFEP